MYKLVYLPKALNEFEESLEWYSERSEQASENFIIEIQNKLKEIKSNPFKFRNRHRNFYEARLNGFLLILYLLSRQKES